MWRNSQNTKIVKWPPRSVTRDIDRKHK
jgi:hypothetical protein